MQPSRTLKETPCAPSTMVSLPPSLPPSLFSLPSSLSGLPSALPSLPGPLPGRLFSLQGGQLGEKQLFEKFWKGTFKAVATPRAESVIVASITARTRLARTETSVCGVVSLDERKDTGGRVVVSDRRRCNRDKKRKHGCRRRPRSLSPVEDVSPRPPPKGKRKRRKSERRRKRKRSPSYSLSPLRKKKKKRKKSSKKSKKHRCSSKKNKHSSSSLKRKRKENRKQKKSSWSLSHHKRRCRRSESDSSACRSSSAESRSHRDHSAADRAPGARHALREVTTATLEHRGHAWGPTAKSVCKTAPSHRSVLSTGTSLPAKPGDETLNAKGIHHRTSPPPSKEAQDYDSGNDTSSPPSAKTGVTRVNDVGHKRIQCPNISSLEKLKFPEGDNASDSGNSVTSYASLCKTLHVEGGLVSCLLHRNRKSSEPQMTPSCRAKVVVRTRQNAVSPVKVGACSRRQAGERPPRSASRSSGRSRISGRRCSRSRSPSSIRSYSRSESSSDSVRRRGSVGSSRSSRSHSAYRPDSRVREQRRSPSFRERDDKSGRQSTRKRHRRKSYSPMRKRRRDSPSHLEARRITSARKRPIPYFRPSPSSSRSGSLSSWSSLFSRSSSRGRSLFSRSSSRGRSLISRRSSRGRSLFSRRSSRGRSLFSRRSSRGRSDSSYRSYSRSSSWNSIFGGRSRSHSRCRSYDSSDKAGKARR